MQKSIGALKNAQLPKPGLLWLCASVVTDSSAALIPTAALFSTGVRGGLLLS